MQGKRIRYKNWQWYVILFLYHFILIKIFYETQYSKISIEVIKKKKSEIFEIKNWYENINKVSKIVFVVILYFFFFLKKVIIILAIDIVG